MSKLEELIQKLCPKGVEYKPLNNVVKSISTGLNPRKNFTLNIEGATNFYVTVKEITTGKIVFSDKTDKITDEALDIIQDRSNLEFGDVLLSGIGTIGKVALVDIPIGNWNCSESVFLIKPKNDVITSAFLAHILGSKNVQKFFQGKARGSTLKGIRQQDLKQLKIPVPPIEVQEEIVRILDKFTELTAELTARKKQYEFYRDQLLSFNGINDTTNNRTGGGYNNLLNCQVKWVRLGNIATITRGGNFQKKDFCSDGVACIHYGQIYTKYDLYTNRTFTFIPKNVADKSKKAVPNDIVMAVTSENIEDVCKCVAWLGNEDIAVSGHTAIIHHNQNAKYLSYFFHTKMFFEQKRKYAHGTKVIEVTPNKLEDIIIPIPSLENQASIVDILDKFHSLVTDISEGLPAEIEARQKQYEYYRDKLLTFEEIAQ